MKEKKCAAGCGKNILKGKGHVFRDPVDGQIPFYHIDCCPLCPRAAAVGNTFQSSTIGSAAPC